MARHTKKGKKVKRGQCAYEARKEKYAKREREGIRTKEYDQLKEEERRTRKKWQEEHGKQGRESVGAASGLHG
jgi:hypothetical protein